MSGPLTFTADNDMMLAGAGARLNPSVEKCTLLWTGALEVYDQVSLCGLAADAAPGLAGGPWCSRRQQSLDLH